MLRAPSAAPGIAQRAKTGAGGGTRTLTGFLPTDFKSAGFAFAGPLLAQG